MSRVIGRGRYATETYPSGPGGGGGAGGASVPLSRQRFIDGDTVQAGLNGSAAEPFKTIAQFMASRSNLVSIADSTAPYIGWMMPAIGGYVEAVAFPAYASTELRADSFTQTLGTGTVITSDVTWPNVTAPGIHAGVTPTATMHNVSVDGSITITDDGGAPTSNFIFGGDEVGNGTVSLTGDFIATGATHLATALFTNAVVQGDIDAGGAAVGLVHSTVEGVIVAGTLQAIDSSILSDTITTTGASAFTDVNFGTGTTLNCGGIAVFDGPSWRSFVEAGRTRIPGDTGTVVTVRGGYSGAAVEGATLPATGAVGLAINGGGIASVGYRGGNSGNHYSTPASGLTAGVGVTLLPTGALPGDTILISRVGIVGAFALTITNGGPAAGTVGIVPASNRGSVLAQFDGTNWSFASGGALAG